MQIALQHVTKSFGQSTVMRDITLQVEGGDAVLLVGANGSGKTTLMRLMAGLLQPTSGQVFVDGNPISRSSRQIQRHIGFLSHQTMLYNDLSAAQNLRFFGRMYGVHNLSTRIETVLDQVGLLSRRDDRVRELSRGMQQRLAIARALLHDPCVLLIDEPFNGLDERAIASLCALLSQWLVDDNANVRVLILSSHRSPPPGLTLNRILRLAHGQLVEDKAFTEVATCPQPGAYL